MKAAVDIQEEKKQIIKSLERINDKALIHAIQNIIDFANQKDEEYLGESLEDYNQALEKADKEIDKGNFVEHEEAIKKIGEWRAKGK
ncbi:MAG: hypothetical protein K2U26_15205 [Cyclobacteriaceae bacterium]|nr:hypothetical protein [Cyclobacteriaceae bacterium]